jgi:hypothetical protein
MRDLDSYRRDIKDALLTPRHFPDPAGQFRACPRPTHSQRIGWHKESNWVQTWPGKGYNVMLRLYGRLEPWFDKTWRPGEIEELKQLLPKSQFVTG